MITNKVIFYLIIVIWFCIRFPLLLRLYMYSYEAIHLMFCWYLVAISICTGFPLLLELFPRLTGSLASTASTSVAMGVLYPQLRWRLLNFTHVLTFTNVSSLSLLLSLSLLTVASSSQSRRWLHNFTLVLTFTFTITNSGIVFSVKTMVAQFHYSSHFL